MAYSVLHECDKCGHNNVCGKKQQYEAIRRKLVDVDDICSNPDIQISVSCLNYLPQYHCEKSNLTI